MDESLKEDASSRKSVRPGRRRNPATQEAILAASLRLTGRVGYARLTMEGIAAEAGVGKQTLYRWWPSRAAVVLEAFARDASAAVEVRLTGDRGADLAAFLVAVHRRIGGPGGVVFRSLLAEALIDPEFASELYEHYLRGRVAELKAVLGGREIGKNTLDRVVEMTYGAIWFRLATRQPLTATHARRLAEAALRVIEG